MTCATEGVAQVGAIRFVAEREQPAARTLAPAAHGPSAFSAMVQRGRTAFTYGKPVTQELLNRMCKKEGGVKRQCAMQLRAYMLSCGAGFMAGTADRKMEACFRALHAIVWNVTIQLKASLGCC
jgi:hypothetical protein